MKIANQMIRKVSCMAAMALLSPIVINAQEVSAKFTVCPLNVDGLPLSILGINLNPDGPGEEGTAKIGKYLVEKGFDVVALSEDFNYHQNLRENSEEMYEFGTYRGGLESSSLDFSNLRFFTDGLNLMWKKGLTMSGESWTGWEQSYGKFTDGADELITKGYRKYTITFADGIEVDFFILHMDANTDTQSNAARASQWEQLRDVILSSKNGRPKIVMGDTNSRYTRDSILKLFTNPIIEAGNYTVTDVWVEKCKNGVYPVLGSNALMVGDLGYRRGEIVDKVIYLNPTHGGVKLTPQYIEFDEAYTLGDHKPVIVEFVASGTEFRPTAAENWWVGEALDGNDQEVYLYNVGSGFFVTNNSRPAMHEIEQGLTWFIKGNPDSGFTVENSDGYMLKMAGIVEGSGATTFSYESGDTEGTYKLTSKVLGQTRYFNVDVKTAKGDIAYTSASSKSEYNDWMLISKDQKDAHEAYVQAYNAANRLYGGELPDYLKEELSGVLSKKSNFTSSAQDTQELYDIVTKINENVLASLDPSSSVDGSTVVAIYDITGTRIDQMSKGLNILQMSDGTSRKVFIK